jgi:hypothetical protein
MTNYRVYVVYEFDFDDDLGVQQIDAWLDFKTTPSVYLNSFSLVSSNIQINDDLLIRFVFENQIEAKIN